MSFELGGSVATRRLRVQLRVLVVVVVVSVEVLEFAFRAFWSSLELAFIAASIFTRFIFI